MQTLIKLGCNSEMFNKYTYCKEKLNSHSKHYDPKLRWGIKLKKEMDAIKCS